MKLSINQGAATGLAEVDRAAPGYDAEIATPQFSLYGFGAARAWLDGAGTTRLILPSDPLDAELFGQDADRVFRNRLNSPALASPLAAHLMRADVRFTRRMGPQGIIGVRRGGVAVHAIAGQCALSTVGLGVTPGHQMSLIQATETPAEATQLSSWCDQMWRGVPRQPEIKASLLNFLQQVAEPNVPSRLYHAVLYHVFRDLGGELDEERIVRSGTGIRDTVVWNKLFRFQRDGVIGVIDKLERLGGCIVADSVGLGKTFTALAVIKSCELRNDRVLVLAPKRLRDNWTLYNDHAGES